MSIQRIVQSIVLIAAALASGCAEETIVGKWDGGDDARDNELRVDDDLRGEATIVFAYAGEVWEAEFDVTATETDDGYELDLECDGCSELDFTMTCSVTGDDDRMDCDGDGSWEDYDFEWEKR